MKIDNLPKLSIAVPTLNNASLLPEFFEKINNQNYPKNKVEIIVADGGSTDKTVDVAKKFGAKIFRNTKVLAEPGVALAMSEATGDIIIVLAVDNFLYDRKSFLKYAETFDDPKIFAAFPKHESKKWDTVYTKYVNEFTDPFSHFIYGYASNGRTFKKAYKTVESNQTYDVYDFKSSDDAPLIALAQGFSVRAKYKRDIQQEMDDIKPVMEMIKQGRKIAFIHSIPLYHHTIRSLGHFVRKQRWATRNALSKQSYGVSFRLTDFSGRQRLRLKISPFYALSFFIPVLFSFYHIIKDRQLMWILHGPLCFIAACSSLYEVMVYNISKQKVVSRQ